jgi:hypothetical protein
MARYQILYKELYKKSGFWWLTPAILPTWEADNVRIIVPGQLGQKYLRDLHPNGKKYMRWCVTVVPATVGSIK